MATGCGTITVEEAFKSSNVTTTGCTNLPNEVNTGSQFTLNYTVENTNNVAANATIEVFQQQGTGSRTSVGSTTKQISANGTESGSFTVTAPSSSGDYILSVEVTSASEA